MPALLGECGSTMEGKKMTAGKSLAIIALLVGGASLAMAQNSTVKTGQTGPKQPRVANPYTQPAAPWSDLYMSTTGSHYKRLRTGQQGPKQPQ